MVTTTGRSTSDGGAVSRRRLAVAGALGLLAWAAVLVRVVDVALVHHQDWVDEAERQQQRTIRLAPERGALLDREGRALAVSLPAWSAWVDPSAVPERDRDAVARRLSSLLETDARKLKRQLALPRSFAWLQRKLPRERMELLQAAKLPGVSFVKESRRVYPNGEVAAPVLGFVGTDGAGLEGLELALDRDVAGTPGFLLTVQDARGDEFMPGGLSCKPSVPGEDVVLTLDTVIQHVAERELRAAAERTGAESGSIIVMFPLTGEIVALSNHPTYDPNKFPTHPSHLRTNRAVASCYEPGSTLKIFTAAAALEAGMRPTDVIDCENGSIVVGRSRIHDHHPFGLLTMADVLASSSNVGAIKMGMRAGATRLHDVLARVGLGRRTGIGLPGESAGILRNPSSWGPTSIASIAFGQEVAVSPLQLVVAASAVAAGGVLTPPRIVKERRAVDGTSIAVASAPARRVLAPRVAAALTTMLEGVVEHGTGQAAAVPGYRVAGKTGTAEVVGPDGTYLEDRHVASFVGWVPSRAPAFVVLVVLDDPRGAYHGGDVAAPVFAALARDVLRYLQVPPDIAGHVLAPDAARSTADAT